MGKFSLLNEFVLFLRENKKLWLLPIVITLLLVGAPPCIRPGISAGSIYLHHFFSLGVC